MSAGTGRDIRRAQGGGIPLLSRILAVADTYDAITEDRAYRKAVPHEAAVEEINKNAGTQFDPHVVSVFTENIHRLIKEQDSGH
jgi:HD-GYP domain-containing protein (c-di-GMP phosphodiesterase class II)